MLYTTHNKLLYTEEITALMEGHDIPSSEEILAREVGAVATYSILQATGTWFENFKSITVPLGVDSISQSFDYALNEDMDGLLDKSTITETVKIFNSTHPVFQFEEFIFTYKYDATEDALTRMSISYQNIDENSEVSCKYFNFPSYYTFTNGIITYGYHYFRRQIGHSTADGVKFNIESNGLTKMMAVNKMIPWNLTYEELKLLRLKFGNN